MKKYITLIILTILTSQSYAYVHPGAINYPADLNGHPIKPSKTNNACVSGYSRVDDNTNLYQCDSYKKLATETEINNLNKIIYSNAATLKSLDIETKISLSTVSSKMSTLKNQINTTLSGLETLIINNPKLQDYINQQVEIRVKAERESIMKEVRSLLLK